MPPPPAGGAGPLAADAERTVKIGATAAFVLFGLLLIADGPAS